MRILIVTTFFPPDTAIAAVRPYMFAKYLCKMGHEITVLRSGEINSMADDSVFKQLNQVKVYSYLGENSLAEKFERGEVAKPVINKSRASFLPKRLHAIAGKIYHFVFSQREFKKRMSNIDAKFVRQRAFLDNLKRNGETFDVVFATFGGLENVYAGEYAAKLFNCKYILDFRDLIAQTTFNKRKEYQMLLNIQTKAILTADVCTCVSEHITKELQEQVPEQQIVTLYNGYEPIEEILKKNSISSKCLSFCYTGQLYAGLRDASPLFYVLSKCCMDGKMEKDYLKFYYAGIDFQKLLEQAKLYKMESILVNMGYLGRQEILELQCSSDVFTVLSWNTHHSHGILTGKFYEGIRCNKPILTIVSGDEANSELKLMNEKYHYGFCYEAKNDSNDFNMLKEWLLELYLQKKLGMKIESNADEDFFVDFKYENLAHQLNEIISDLLSEGDIKNA